LTIPSVSRRKSGSTTPSTEVPQVQQISKLSSICSPQTLHFHMAKTSRGNQPIDGLHADGHHFPTLPRVHYSFPNIFCHIPGHNDTNSRNGKLFSSNQNRFHAGQRRLSARVHGKRGSADIEIRQQPQNVFEMGAEQQKTRKS